ncbi:HTH-type transcriptional regulator NimR [Methylobacterium brachiatum]|nr:HTH-type transcriptional regulator NimR [Methylobacterium brachiatum]
MANLEARCTLDWSECSDEPDLVAFWAGDGPKSPFRLGTQEVDWHQHVRGQILCVENGLFHVRTQAGSWLLPPGRAGYLPPGVGHWVSVSGVSTGWSILIAPAACAALPAQPCIVAVNAVMRALVQRAAWADPGHLGVEQARLAAVLLDEVRCAPEGGFHLPMPHDPHLLRIATVVLRRPGERRTLETMARAAGLSERTARRHFQMQTGMSFGRWRLQAGLVHARERLADGAAVAEVSDALGYAHPSNFIAMFRRVFGEPPGRYFARHVTCCQRP